MLSDGKKRSTAAVLLFTAGITACAAAAWKGLFSVYNVAGRSMEPALHDGEQVISMRQYTKPKRGSIVLVRHDGAVLIKRAAGLAGDEVRIDSSGRVFINGKPLKWKYIKAAGRPFRCTVPSGRLFLLGDNMEVSTDSRSPLLGCIPVNTVIGRAVMCVSDGGARRL